MVLDAAEWQEFREKEKLQVKSQQERPFGELCQDDFNDNCLRDSNFTQSVPLGDISSAILNTNPVTNNEDHQASRK